jgi:hypothetical protein
MSIIGQSLDPVMTTGPRAALELRGAMPRTTPMNPDDPRFKLTAVFEPAPEGGYTCHFEELPEIFSEGETMEEARANLWDAFEQVMAYSRLANS